MARRAPAAAVVQWRNFHSCRYQLRRTPLTLYETLPSAEFRGRRTFATAADEGFAVDKRVESKRLMQDLKVSPSGTSDALFQESLLAIRRKRAEQESGHMKQLHEDTQAITKLKQDELELTRKIFRRLDPSRDLTSDHEVRGHHIDPYWSPFHKVRELKEQVTAEFDEYARYVNVAEMKRIRMQIKKSLRKMPQAYNPYSNGFASYHGRTKGMQEPPQPFRIPDKHWVTTPLQERLAKERINWRDVDIIQHFLADNGYILPRRTTMLPRHQQAKLVLAVKNAQRMSLIPYLAKPKDYQAMPLMDPLQWMVERLTDRVIEAGDRRSRAMLQVMLGRHSELNYSRFLRHESQNSQSHASDSTESAA